MKKERRIFEIGEEVWFLWGKAAFPKIMSAKITGIEDPWGDGKHQLKLYLDSFIQPMIISCGVFKSREELCEHYRKIFE